MKKEEKCRCGDEGEVDYSKLGGRENIKLDRVWSMPSRWTFTIKPIKELLDVEVGGRWADPFCGKNGGYYAEALNDIEYGGVDALEWLKGQKDNEFDGVLYDPPYSITQARMCGRKYWYPRGNQMEKKMHEDFLELLQDSLGGK